MIPAETLAAFFTASVLLALTPGPDNLFVLTESARHGKLTGLFVTLGLCTGLIVHTSAVAFGVAVIFQASALAFTGLKFFGSGFSCLGSSDQNRNRNRPEPRQALPQGYHYEHNKPQGFHLLSCVPATIL